MVCSRPHWRLFLITFLTITYTTTSTAVLRAQNPIDSERVLIETAKPYDRVAAAIRSSGGRVTQQFKYVDAIGAEIPLNALESIRKLVGPANMLKDIDVPAPHSVSSNGGRTIRGKQIGPVVTAVTQSSQALPPSAIASYAGSHPDLYSLNNAGTRVDRVQAKGFTGEGVIVAVLDSGIRPGVPLLESDGSVMNIGDDFVGDGLGFSNVKNEPHGTFIAGLISGNAEFVLNGPLLDAVRRYAPNALDPVTERLSLLGTAPSAKIYVMRVFGTDPAVGAPLSVILSAIQRVIDLRRNFDRGIAGGVNIQVCNMSFGVPTLKAGRTLLDRSVDVMLDEGIVPVVSAGNAGPSSLTTASPGSSMSAVTVGAASFAPNERIGTEVEMGPGVGLLQRPFSGTQTAWFSSRGPNADGRVDPDIVTSGMVNFGQGYCAKSNKVCPKEVSLMSGTSFSAPIASGVAAILRQAFPRAKAVEIRNAIVNSGRPSQIEDGSTKLDRGEGLVDALGAYYLLASGNVSESLPRVVPPDSDVRVNVEANTDLRVRGGTFTQTVRNLKPGERADILYDVVPGTSLVTVTITSITPALPPDKQNQLFGGDGLFVAIHSAKTSAIGEGDYVALEYPRSAVSLTAADPDTGLMRITITGDWVNAGTVSATVRISSVVETLPRITAKGNILDKQTLAIPLTIPSGINVAEFLLSWRKDWSYYPTSDIDLILVTPTGKTNTAGVTGAGPERVAIQNPRRGDWLMLIDGFEIPSGKDYFELRVTLDGQLVK